jgi:hypothetical protein
MVVPEKFPEASRRKRQRVSHAIQRALARITERDPVLGHILREAIETGRFLSYSPHLGSASTNPGRSGTVKSAKKKQPTST